MIRFRWSENRTTQTLKGLVKKVASKLRKLNNGFSTCSDKALVSKRDHLGEQIQMIARVPGNIINFVEARGIIYNLSELQDLIKNEIKRRGIKE